MAWESFQQEWRQKVKREDLAMHALCQDLVRDQRKWENEIPDPATKQYLFPAWVLVTCLCAAALGLALWTVCR